VKLIEAIKAEAALQKGPLAISREYADLILPGVRGRLNLDPKGKDWLTARLIKTTLGRMKSDSS